MSLEKVFILQHLHVLNDSEEDVKLIGVYSTRDQGIAAIERLRMAPGFRDLPDLVEGKEADNQAEGFYLSEFVLDQDSWSTGYQTT